MPIDIAVVPVAGFGTRLLPATKSQPKEMLPVGRRPVVQYVVEELASSGIRRLLFITGQGKDSIENHFDLNKELETYLRESGREEQLSDIEFVHQQIEYFYTRQREQLGLGHAVLCSEPFVGQQPFVVALGDSIIGLHAKTDINRRMIAEFERTGADLVVAFEEVPAADVIHYGIAKFRPPAGDVFVLEDVIEKPSVEEAPSNLAVAARYVFSPRIFAALHQTPPGKAGEIQLTDAIRLILKQGGKGIGMRLNASEKRYDIGDFDSYFRAFCEFALADPEYGPALKTSLLEILKLPPQKQ